MNEYISLKDIMFVVNRLEDKLDGRLDAIEKEVKELQGYKNKLLGLASIISIIVSLAIATVWNKLFGI